jgi:Tol biopolymer transport system component
VKLAAGVSLPPYRLVEPIGEGGMGVVWRATDGALGRDAAIKFLPDLFSHDPERLARFEREAKLLASLSHPNIAAIYGLHVADGLRFIAMEMIKGEDLAARLARGPIPVDEAIELGRQIADALEAAHEQGVVHRDLKPANVRVTAEGVVKVLDFGLAKAFDAAPASGSVNPALSPTVTSAGSVMGLILGTAAYMSPEQARGKPLDRRTDIWSFGCVLYEMLTARRPFSGETVSDSIGRILQTEADLTALPAETPRAVRELIARCLIKDPKKRLRDIGEARLALEAPQSRKVEDVTSVEGRGSRAWIPWAVAALAIVTAVAAIARTQQRTADAGAPRIAKYVALNAPEDLIFSEQPGDLAVSPDGRSIVVVAVAGDGTDALSLRRLDEPKWVKLPGTEGAYFPFWSPDGRLIAFFAGDKLKKVSIGGGSADTICAAAAGRGGTWMKDGVIVFSPGSNGPLMQVKGDGGPVTPATELDASRGEVNHRFPFALPDGKHFLYASVPVRDGLFESWIATLGAKDRKPVIASDGLPAFSAPDRLVYHRNGTLYVRSFDPETARLAGEPRALVGARQPAGFLASPVASVGGSGVLAFQPIVDASTQLTWFTLDGAQGESIPLPPGQFSEVVISPDGSHVSTSRFEESGSNGTGADVWLIDLSKNTGARATFDPQIEFGTVWSPDGRYVYYSGNKTGQYLIYRIPAGTAGDAVALSPTMGLTETPMDISPDGRLLVFETQEPKTGDDLWILDTSGGKPPVPYLTSPANELDARISPDGRWVAYTSDETGKTELYLQSFPTPGSKLQVSNGGARLPVWRRDGKRLFFLDPTGALMAADVTLQSALRVAVPVRVCRLPRATNGYDLARDGKRILASIPTHDVAGRSIGVILDWDAPPNK